MAGLLRRDAACARLLLLALLLLCLVACAESGALGAILREKVSEKSDSLAAWFDAKLKLSSTGTLKEESVIKSDRPTDTEEARVSLRSGKQVDEAKLSLSIGPKIWTMTVKSSDLSLNSMKLPALLGTTDEDCVYERLALLEECQDTFDALFATFARLRLDDRAWSAEIEAMREWVQSELED